MNSPPTYTKAGFATAIAAVAIAAFLIGMAFGAGAFDKIQPWQTLLAALIALLAAMIAYFNTNRQIAAAIETARVQKIDATIEALRLETIRVDRLRHKVVAIPAWEEAVCSHQTMSHFVLRTAVQEKVIRDREELGALYNELQLAGRRWGGEGTEKARRQIGAGVIMLQLALAEFNSALANYIHGANDRAEIDITALHKPWTKKRTDEARKACEDYLEMLRSEIARLSPASTP